MLIHNPPCKGCKDRRFDPVTLEHCRTTCEAYIAWEKREREIKGKMLKEKLLSSHIAKAQYNALDKARRRNK